MGRIISFNNSLFRAIIIVSVLFSLLSCNNQKEENTQDLAETSNEAKFNSTDKARDAEFLVKVAEINLEEIELGQLAQQKSKNANIKELGKIMETQHRQCYIDLTDLAHKETIIVPTAPNNGVENDFQMLNKKSGYDFDTTYCNIVVGEHKKMIDMFEKEHIESSDIPIKQWVSTTLPALHTSLDAAIACRNKYKK